VREADHSPPSSVEVTNVWRYLHSPNTPSWRGDQLKKHRDNFNFTFFYPVLKHSQYSTSLIVRDQVSHPCKTAGEMLYTFQSLSFERKREDEVLN